MVDVLGIVTKHIPIINIIMHEQFRILFFNFNPVSYTHLTLPTKA